MYESLSVVDDETARHVIKKAAETLSENLDPELLILTGSYARGDYVHGVSDIDLFLVSDKLRSMSTTKRFSYFSALTQTSELPVEIFGYTMEEVERRMDSLNPILLDAVYFGIPLISKHDAWTKLKERMRELTREHGLAKVPNGWKWDK